MSLLVGLNSSVSILPAQFVGNDPKWWSMIGQKTKQIIYDTVYAYYKMNTTQPSRSSFQKNPLRSFGGSWNEWMRTSAIKGIFTKLLLFGEKGRLGGVSGDRYEENTSLLEITTVTRILCWVFTGFFMVFPQFFPNHLHKHPYQQHYHFFSQAAERIPFITRLSSFQLSRAPQHRGVKSHVTKAGDPFSSWLRK